MDFAIFLGILVGASSLVFLQICIAKEFERIAAKKGHKEKRYFWWTLFLGAVGMMMVMALPDHGSKAQQEAAAYEELPEI